jgi:tripartite-type tricarboxylate transporter receptor subunit TctC
MHKAFPSLVVLLLVAAACAPSAAPVATNPPAQPTTAKPAAKSAPPTAAPVAPSAPAVAPTASAARPAATAAQAKTGPSPVAPAAAFDEKAVADFYRGKTVRILVGYAPGGTFDLYSRFLAKALPGHIPGSPSVIVENKPGADSLIVANTVYRTEAKDGTVIGNFHENQVVLQATDSPGVEFDGRTYNWLGSVDKLEGVHACLARTNAGIKGVQELIGGKELAMATTGKGSGTHGVPGALNQVLGTRFKLVPGYSGVAPAVLAVDSNEVDGLCMAYGAMLSTGQRLLEGDNPVARIFVIMGSETPQGRFLQGVPAVETLVKTEEGKLLLRAVHPYQMAKPYAVPPEVPKDRVAALRKAFTAAFADPAFQSEARAASLTPSFTSGEEVAQIVDQVLSMPADLRSKLRDILNQ